MAAPSTALLPSEAAVLGTRTSHNRLHIAVWAQGIVFRVAVLQAAWNKANYLSSIVVLLSMTCCSYGHFAGYSDNYLGKVLCNSFALQFLF